ncbi:MAG: VOC family protein [Candidatus Bathyarchaeia archaeon]
MIEELDHVGISVSNLAKSLDFYQNLFGLKFVEEFDVPQFNLHVVFLRAGKAMIELLDYGSKAKIPQATTSGFYGIRHLTFIVQDLDKVCEELRRKGISFTRPPTTIIPGRIRNAFLLGPDGESIELIERRP